MSKKACSANIMSPDFIENNTVLNNKTLVNKTVAINNIIHKSGNNNNESLSLLIYSDVLEQIFECGNYSVN